MTVVDLGTLTPGKYASSLLAQLGADVIRVERPGTETKALSDEDLVLNRNKRSMVLDLRTTEGLNVLDVRGGFSVLKFRVLDEF